MASDNQEPSQNYETDGGTPEVREHASIQVLEPNHATRSNAGPVRARAAENTGIQSAARKKTKGTKDSCFRETGEPYVPKLEVWDAIRRDLDASRKNFPTEFGPFFNFGENVTKGNLTAYSWETWCYKQSLIYVRTVLPAEHFEHYRRFVLVSFLVSRNEIKRDHIPKIAKLFEDFVEYYEREIYRYVAFYIFGLKYSRLRPVRMYWHIIYIICLSYTCNQY